MIFLIIFSSCLVYFFIGYFVARYSIKKLLKQDLNLSKIKSIGINVPPPAEKEPTLFPPPKIEIKSANTNPNQVPQESPPISQIKPFCKQWREENRPSPTPAPPPKRYTQSTFIAGITESKF